MRNRTLKRERKKVECDRCGRVLRDGDLLYQDGLEVCKRCYDEPSYGEREDK